MSRTIQMTDGDRVWVETVGDNDYPPCLFEPGTWPTVYNDQEVINRIGKGAKRV